MNNILCDAAVQLDLAGLLASLQVRDTAREMALAVLKTEQVTPLQILTGEVTDEVRTHLAPLRAPPPAQDRSHPPHARFTNSERHPRH